MKRRITENDLKKYARELAKRIQLFPEGGKIIVLEGEMGTGKTTFTNFFLQAFQISQSSSPSFSLIQVYQNEQITCIHADFQRITSSESFALIEEYETPYPNALWIIEWAPNEWKNFFETPIIHLCLEHGENESFRYLQTNFYHPHTLSVESAKKMQDEWKTPVHVRRHIEVVRKVAVFCAQKLEENGFPIDIDLVESAALLHDGVRYVDFKSFDENDTKHYQEEVSEEKIRFWKRVKEKYIAVGHEKAMSMILTEQGFEATGKVIEAHRSSKIYEKDHMSWEEKCLHYADKRAKHDTFVPLLERLIDGAHRHGHMRSERFEMANMALEKELQEAGKWEEESLEKNIW